MQKYYNTRNQHVYANGKLNMNASLPLKEEMLQELPWLFREFGLQITESNFNPKIFGDSFVILRSSAFRVRFVRDRGQNFAEVASLSDPQTWWNLENVCEIITGRKVEISFQLPAVANLLRNIFRHSASDLGPRYVDTKQELERRAEVRRRAFLKRPPN